MAITQKRAWRAGWICVLVLGAGRATAAAEYAVHGYLREYLSVNLEDKPEPNAHGEAIGGAGQLAMARTVFKLDADAKFDSFYVKAVGRFSRENRTPYLEELEKTAQAGHFPVARSSKTNTTRTRCASCTLASTLARRRT